MDFPQSCSLLRFVQFKLSGAFHILDKEGTITPSQALLPFFLRRLGFSSKARAMS